MKKLLLGVLTLSVLALGLTLTSSRLPVLAGEDEEEAVALTILLGEMFFQVEGQEKNAPIVLRAGEKYEITFKNIGSVLHEAMFGLTPKEVDGQLKGYETNLFEGVEVAIVGEMNGEEFEIEAEGLVELELHPGQELVVEFTLPEDKKGEWEIGCFLPGHYQAGMKAPLIVE